MHQAAAELNSRRPMAKPTQTRFVDERFARAVFAGLRERRPDLNPTLKYDKGRMIGPRTIRQAGWIITTNGPTA